jgi:hypothetical protein
VVRSRSIDEVVGLDIANRDAGPESDGVGYHIASRRGLHASRQIDGHATRQKRAAPRPARTKVSPNHDRASGLQPDAVLSLQNEVTRFGTHIESQDSDFGFGLGSFLVLTAAARNRGDRTDNNSNTIPLPRNIQRAHAYSSVQGKGTVE